MQQENRYSEDVVLSVPVTTDSSSSSSSSASSSASAQNDADVVEQGEGVADAVRPASGAGVQLQSQQPVVVDNGSDESAAEILSLDVDLLASADIQYKALDGLTYALHPESGTASLVGISTAAKDAVSIPETIAVGNGTYTITNICPMGGGGSANLPLTR